MNTTLDPCGKNISTLRKLMGGFWSDVSKKTTGVKRTALDQARMQLLQQLLAAELNASAFGSVPAGGSGKFAVWEAAYCGTSQTAIQNAMQGAASFNNSGDSGTFTPGTSADSKNARAIADKVFWNACPNETTAVDSRLEGGPGECRALPFPATTVRRRGPA